jgi:hypothetical protein
VRISWLRFKIYLLFLNWLLNYLCENAWSSDKWQRKWLLYMPFFLWILAREQDADWSWVKNATCWIHISCGNEIWGKYDLRGHLKIYAPCRPQTKTNIVYTNNYWVISILSFYHLLYHPNHLITLLYVNDVTCIILLLDLCKEDKSSLIVLQESPFAFIMSFKLLSRCGGLFTNYSLPSCYNNGRQKIQISCLQLPGSSTTITRSFATKKVRWMFAW